MTVVGDPLRITLELAPDREPVEGSLQLGSDRMLAFTGWMELIAALESVLAERKPRPGGAKA